MYEKNQIQLKYDELVTDFESISRRYDHAKKQNDRQEKDFHLFSRKIQSQQSVIMYLVS